MRPATSAENHSKKLDGEWMRGILAKTNLEYVSGYNMGGPDYLYKDKVGRIIPSEIKWRAGQMTAVAQLMRYIHEYHAPFGVLVLGGTWHQTWHRMWRRVRYGLTEEQWDKIIFLLL